MNVTTGCSWCKTVNGLRTRWCKTCGHAAWLARELCDCRACLGVLFVESPSKKAAAGDGGDQVEVKPTTKTKTARNRK